MFMHLSSKCTRIIAYFLHTRATIQVVVRSISFLQQDLIPDVEHYNAKIRSTVANRHYEEAMMLYSQMLRKGLPPNEYTLPFVIKACTKQNTQVSFQLGMLIHGYNVQRGFQSNPYVQSALIDMYGSCAKIKYASQVFDEMPYPDIASLNSMISVHAKNGQIHSALELYVEIISGRFRKINAVTYAIIFSLCYHQSLGIKKGKELHVHVLKLGLDWEVLVGNSLISMYAKCGDIDYALKVFDKMPDLDIVSWNAVIGGCADNELWELSLDLYREMVKHGFKPNSATHVGALPACTLKQAKEIHCYLFRSEFKLDPFVASAFIDVYAKFGYIDGARILFERVSDIDVVLWTAMISAFVQNGYCDEALCLFWRYLAKGLKPNSATIASILPAFGIVGELSAAKELHGYIVRHGLENHPFVQSALVDMFCKFGLINDAYCLFKRLETDSVFAWNAMITGFAQAEQWANCITLFQRMFNVGVKPDKVTLSLVLSACAHLAALAHGKAIHAYCLRNSFGSIVSVTSALVDMYSKSGSLDVASKIFQITPGRNLVTWNTMIAGYGLHGFGHEAIELFCDMKISGVKPDHVTFLAVMFACNHAGLVEEGCKYFVDMKEKFCIQPRLEHYSCMIDLLGRMGRLDEAYGLIHEMDIEPDVGIWGALLGACLIHDNIALGELAAEQLFRLEPENAVHYVLLSNMYAKAGRWDRALQMRTISKNKGLVKTPGCSWIEINDKVHSFIAGDAH